MSDAVMHEPFSIHPAPTTGDMEDDDEIRRLRAWLAQADAVESWKYIEGEPEVVLRLVIEPKTVVSSGPNPLPTDGLLVEHDVNGDVIVGDPTGAAYGLGASLGEAFQQWEETARQHYQDLSEQADSLHPRMVRQLHYLRRLFG